MPKPKKPITTPQEIVLADTVLYTTIDPVSRIHYIECDICRSSIQLTVTAKPHAFEKHRQKCVKENSGKQGNFKHHIFALTTVPEAIESVHVPPPPRNRLCSGYTIQWTAGSIWSTYPYHQHSIQSLPWYPASFDPEKNTITLRSVMCPTNIPSNKTTCSSCEIIGLEPCGFCGLDGCSLHLSGNHVKTMTVTSSCLYQHDNWSYKTAVTGTPNLPCTNVPTYCELCPKVENGEMKAIWRYNIIMHMILRHEQLHPELSNTYILPKIPGSMLLNAYISLKEEEAMGVTSQATVEYRDDFGMMKSDDPALEGYKDDANPRLKAKRKLTLSIVDSYTKKLKESC